MSPRKKKSEEIPIEKIEKEEKKPARRRTTSKPKEKVEAKEEKIISEVSKIEPVEEPLEVVKATEEETAEIAEESEKVSEGPRQETPEELKEAKKDKDNIREVEIDISQLQNMPIREIYKLARKYDVANYTQMAKKDLIFAVLKAQTESYGYFFDQGVLEITDGGYGFLRTLENNLLPSSNDIYVSQSQIRRFNLTSGDTVAGQVRPPKEGEKYFALLR
ncbi:MAG TPA: Rho termination factor N-terminal domain-containing protein, partial [Mesotoga sp.]|nr:Rho termination factor N-terminal domain-containing protein [Mesotoga sp.]